MKTYILKYDVHNHIDFPTGTIVKITDDYWGSGSNDLNTGFTVVEGKLKGNKGCVADGLDGWLLDDTKQNRKLLSKFKKEREKSRIAEKNINKKWKQIPTCKI